MPLFPRYLFIILDLTRDHWRSVNGTYGVNRLLMRAEEPEPVPEGLVEQLIEMSETNGAVRYTPYLRSGQVILGYFANANDQGATAIGGGGGVTSECER